MPKSGHLDNAASLVGILIDTIEKHGCGSRNEEKLQISLSSGEIDLFYQRIKPSVRTTIRKMKFNKFLNQYGGIVPNHLVTLETNQIFVRRSPTATEVLFALMQFVKDGGVVSSEQGDEHVSDDGFFFVERNTDLPSSTRSSTPTDKVTTLSEEKLSKFFLTRMGKAFRDAIVRVPEKDKGKSIPRTQARGDFNTFLTANCSFLPSGCHMEFHNGTLVLRESTYEENGTITRQAGKRITFERSNNIADKTSVTTPQLGSPEAFLHYINFNAKRQRLCEDRAEVEIVFGEWARKEGIAVTRRTCPEYLRELRRRKLLKSKRYGDSIVMIFALNNGTFPDITERKQAKVRVMQAREQLEANKCDITVGSDPIVLDTIFVPSGHEHQTRFVVFIRGSKSATTLKSIKLLGPHRSKFSIDSKGFPTLPFNLKENRRSLEIAVQFTSNGVGVYRGVVSFLFNDGSKDFAISRFITIRSGDRDATDLLKPMSPYVKKKVNFREIKEKEINRIPAEELNSKRKGGYSVQLSMFTIPKDVRNMLKQNEMDLFLEQSDPSKDYVDFWQHMLWTMEDQASIDIKLFDMENVKLERYGRVLSLAVPGLAEGRPSVLKGDRVLVTFNGKTYEGITKDTRREDVHLQFSKSFDSAYDPRIDRVNVRFNLARSGFRTGHQGVILAPENMGQRMLFPSENDKGKAMESGNRRQLPHPIVWANSELNKEQHDAVSNILEGTVRPLPYIIYGPPGTGKTTTLVEAIYQLARHRDNLNILVVAPSNDATDNLVDKLASYFPPSEMCRVLAYTRSKDQVSPAAQPYVKEYASDFEETRALVGFKIVAATVNAAAKLLNRGMPRGHFDVVCFDEAGHAIETEVIAVAATLFNFKEVDEKVAQIVMAGDPKQLGPIVSSTLCQKHGMQISYMERLASSPLYQNQNGVFPRELITMLVRNFRSHPKILELPNTLFYDNKLLNCGDRMQTHSMVKWEHLPSPGFPILFHSVCGDNLREGSSPSWFNPQEAQIAVSYAVKLVKDSRPAIHQKDIGIITPYNRQVQKIRMLLKTEDLGDIKVGSVETFQGQERKCIIVSTVRSTENYVEHDVKYNLGFVKSPKRFNVTITRAKALLIVIGEPRILSSDKDSWRPFLTMCKNKGAWVGEEWNEATSKEDDDLDQMGMFEVDDPNNDDGYVFPENVSQMMYEEAIGIVRREE